MFVLIAPHQSVVRIDLVIKPRTERGAPIWRRHALTEGDGIQSGIENRGDDQGVVVDIPFFKINKERRLLLRNGTTEISAELPLQIGRAGGCKGITRIQRLVVEVKGGLTAESIAPGFRQNLDAAHSQAIILGGKGIRINPNFAN